MHIQRNVPAIFCSIGKIWRRHVIESDDAATHEKKHVATSRGTSFGRVRRASYWRAIAADSDGTSMGHRTVTMVHARPQPSAGGAFPLTSHPSPESVRSHSNCPIRWDAHLDRGSQGMEVRVPSFTRIQYGVTLIVPFDLFDMSHPSPSPF